MPCTVVCWIFAPDVRIVWSVCIIVAFFGTNVAKKQSLLLVIADQLFEARVIFVLVSESEFKKGINGATLVLKHRCSQRLARSTCLMPALQWSLGMTIHCKWSSLLDFNSRAEPQGFTWIVASAVYFSFAHLSLLALASYDCPFFPVTYLLFLCLLTQQKAITCSSSIWSAIELRRQGNSWDVMGYFPCLNAYIWVIAVN